MPDPWVELQEAQLLTALTLPKCGLAVTNDIGEGKDIHPRSKQEVGRRLVLIALAKDYGRSGTVFSGAHRQELEDQRQQGADSV